MWKSIVSTKSLHSQKKTFKHTFSNFTRLTLSTSSFYLLLSFIPLISPEYFTTISNINIDLNQIHGLGQLHLSFCSYKFSNDHRNFYWIFALNVFALRWAATHSKKKTRCTMNKSRCWELSKYAPAIRNKVDLLWFVAIQINCVPLDSMVNRYLCLAVQSLVFHSSGQMVNYTYTPPLWSFAGWFCLE